MLTCFGKPVAHVTLRSATAAAAMHRLCEQLGGQGRGVSKFVCCFVDKLAPFKLVQFKGITRI